MKSATGNAGSFGWALRISLVLFLAGLVVSCNRAKDLDLLDQSSPSLSTDKRWLIFDCIRNAQAYIVKHDRLTGRSIRLTQPGGSCYHPIWSHSQDYIVFTKIESGFGHLWRMRPDGTEMQRLTDAPASDEAFTTSADGASVYFVRTDWKGRLLLANRNLWRISMDTSNKSPFFIGRGCSIGSNGQVSIIVSNSPNDAVDSIFLNEPGKTTPRLLCVGFEPALSPDGTKVVYTWITPKGAREVWLIDSKSGATKLISSSDKVISGPRFSNSGTDLVFRILMPETDKLELIICSLSDYSKERLSIERPDNP